MTIDPEQYAKDVMSGKVVAGKLLKLAIKRHEKDLKNGAKKGFRFDPEAGLKVVKFFSLLNHYKGRFQGQPFILLPWQQWMIYVLYGWKRADNTRRFRRAYVEVAKKNGKTAIGAGLCLYHLIDPTEPAAEVYIAATIRDQANLAYKDCEAMAKSSPSIMKRINIQVNSIYQESDFSKIQTLSRDRDSFEGKNASFGLIDEYHLHKDDLAVENLESGMGSRSQPLTFIITTAGFNKSLPCYKQRKICVDILEGKIEEDSTFTVIFAMDDEREWENQANWAKANPSMPHTPSLDFLVDQYKKAKNNPTKIVSFRTKNLNTWMDAEKTWIESKVWQKGSVTWDILETKYGISRDYLRTVPAFGGLDLASTRDINAFSLYIPLDLIGKYLTITWYWIPRDTMDERVKNDSVRYDVWADQGFIQLTEGNVMDYDFVVRDLLDIAEEFSIEKIAYDRWNATQPIIRLSEELGPDKLMPYGQGFASMSPPTKAMETDIMSDKLLHIENPVCGWMLSNTVLATDAAGNVKPDKQKSTEKIDGTVSKVMARGCMMSLQMDLASTGPSKYESEEGLMSL